MPIENRLAVNSGGATPWSLFADKPIDPKYGTGALNDRDLAYWRSGEGSRNAFNSLMSSIGKPTDFLSNYFRYIDNANDPMAYREQMRNEFANMDGGQRIMDYYNSIKGTDEYADKINAMIIAGMLDQAPIQRGSYFGDRSAQSGWTPEVIERARAQVVGQINPHTGQSWTANQAMAHTGLGDNVVNGWFNQTPADRTPAGSPPANSLAPQSSAAGQVTQGQANAIGGIGNRVASALGFNQQTVTPTATAATQPRNRLTPEYYSRQTAYRR